MDDTFLTILQIKVDTSSSLPLLQKNYGKHFNWLVISDVVRELVNQLFHRVRQPFKKPNSI